MSPVCGVCEEPLCSDNSIGCRGNFYHYRCCSITRTDGFEDGCEMKENPLSKRLHPIYKDVIIIGNGPSGMSMSYVLAGHAPTYNGRPHPDAMLDAALRTTLQKNALLTDVDLSSLAQCVEGRGTSTPLGLLLDHLVRPGADAGLRLPPLIDWAEHPTRALSHMVIGKGPPGGTWQTMDGRTMTLSLSSWMELPGLPIHESDVGKKERVSPDGSRVATSTIADYYQEYVHKMGLQKYQKRGIVTSVTEYDDTDAENDKKINWVIDGRDQYGRKFRYLSKFVVLACGTTDSPNWLGVTGERLPWVHHSTRDLDEFLRRQTPSKEDGPVLVVGSGLSACDGVLCAKSHNATAYHLYRGKQGLARWLPLTSYPEYLSVHQLMTGAATCPTYKGTESLRLARCHSGTDGRRLVTLESTEGSYVEVVEVSAVAILVGSTADLSFLPRDDLGVRKGAVDSRVNPLDISLATYQLSRLPNCYAIGPLAGDMFVRHILGGVVAAATHIQKTI